MGSWKSPGFFVSKRVETLTLTPWLLSMSVANEVCNHICVYYCVRYFAG